MKNRNESFSFKRLWALIIRYWAERKLVNGLYWLLTVILLMWLLANMFSVYSVLYKETKFSIPIRLDELLSYYLLFLFVQYLLVFQEYVNRKRAAFLTVVPALQSEKFGSLFVNALVFPTLFYWLTVFTIWALFTKLYTMLYAIDPKVMLRFVPDLYSNGAMYNYILFLFLALMVFLGHFIFRKNQLIYAVLVFVIGVSFVVSVVNSIMIEQYIATGRYNSNSFGNMYLYDDKNSFIAIDNGILIDFTPYSILLVGLFFVGMLYTAYLKMKERQVKV